MNILMNASLWYARLRTGIAVAGLAATLLPAPGCGSQPRTAAPDAHRALRPIVTIAGASAADKDRAALARFVGDWKFEGFAMNGSDRAKGSGRAAASIEREHFVLLDLQAAEGQLSGHAAKKSGSMIFASEPAIGLTLTAWGDASPAMTRMVGEVDANASHFTFNEMRTAPGVHRHTISFDFETDDRWIAEIRDESERNTPVVARYEFTRVAS
ncbi:MAG: hypothetical protein JSR77_08300 [Planctomycetes bacterium]|nr:hypothetical protein [Planctomycetota bacterium]